MLSGLLKWRCRSPCGAGCGYTSAYLERVSIGLGKRAVLDVRIFQCPTPNSNRWALSVGVFFVQMSDRSGSPHSLTASDHVVSFAAERSLSGEDRGIDRILRRLKLHAEGRQFGG
jgi:hypothetical protein